MEYIKGKQWFHGSPSELNELHKGSTITQDENLARIFSHKPSLVIFEDDGKRLHNGKINGYLHIIDEEITLDDVYPHPNTSMEAGLEWLTRRKIKVKKIDETTLDGPERMTDEVEKEMVEIYKIKR